ncbi:hypothetical protein PVAG01_10560 [Phlyctema vagabunda]|uniref:Uncharacterized protein n=1 Tax=Phlyctema vagabunda TaxID=108571 RepID=A0ABR4P2M5_9HELO
MGSQDSDQKVESSQIENGNNTARPGFGSKVKRHCARFWWLHLIIFCVVFLLIALLLVYVGMPKIAQHDVNRSSLEFRELDFLDPTPNTISLTQLGVLHNPSTFTPTLDAFNATLSLVTGGVVANTSFFNIEIPKIHAKGDTDVPIRNQLITVTDMDQLTQYCIAVLQNEEVTTHLDGRTKLHLGALPTVKVNYRESTTYKALNGLKGFNVTDALIDLSVRAGQPNFRGNASIPNPSVMTIAMGNVTLSLATEAKGVVGNATINNMTLRPGLNILPMQAVIDQALVLGSLDAATGLVEMKITGTSAVYNGQNLPYYEEALKSNVLSLSLNVAQILKDSAAAAA